MTINGQAIAADIYRGIKNTITHMGATPHLTVFTCTPNFQTQKFLQLKKRKALEVGIGVNVIEFPGDIKTEEVIQSILHAQMQTDGIIVQLPFPTQVAIDEVLRDLPKSVDVDCAYYDGSTDDNILPPVVGAINEIAKKHNVIFSGAKVVVVGEGRLVGKPSAMWAKKHGAEVVVVDRDTENPADILKQADIIISGAGSPGLIKADMIREGVVIFDAGTTEESGVLKGDADPECSKTASLFTPVPGGIGPITVAILLRNLVRIR